MYPEPSRPGQVLAATIVVLDFPVIATLAIGAFVMRIACAAWSRIGR